jgi:hypothetical protein
VAIPAYEVMQENGMSGRMLDVLMRGISTRQYAEVLPEMASTCGVSKSRLPNTPSGQCGDSSGPGDQARHGPVRLTEPPSARR